MRVLEAFETSEKLANEGRKCEIEFGGKVVCEVVVRPADALLNSEYRRVLAEMAVGRTRPKKNGSGLAIEPDTKEDTEKLYTLYARSVIVSWTWADQADRQTKALKFNEENAVALFRKAPKFFEAIQFAAREWSHFRAANEEEATGN